MVLGVHGACRREELHKLTMDDIKINESYAIIKIPTTKTHCPRTFTLEGTYFEIFQLYLGLRPQHVTTNKLFLRYGNGKCCNQPIGINTIGSMPKNIAVWLELEEPNTYTGHSFRRSSATVFADAGASITTLKRHGGWKSAQIAESYVEDSVQNKRKIGKSITDAIAENTEDIVPNKNQKKQ